jgi:hypothetical protein
MKCDICWRNENTPDVTMRSFTEHTQTNVEVLRNVCSVCESDSDRMAQLPRLVAIPISRAREVFREFVAVYEKENLPVNLPNIDHSSLLQRLLNGKPLLEKAPPKRFSYPAYELAEGKEVEIHEISDLDPSWGYGPDRTVAIDQHIEWTWVDKEKGILKHLLSNELYVFETRSATRKTLRTGSVTDEQYIGKYLKKFNGVLM